MDIKSKIYRFLKSIGIKDPLSYDLEFLSISKSEIDNNKFFYSFNKKTLWSIDKLEEFLHSLNNITTYKYDINFTYEEQFNKNNLKDIILNYLYLEKNNDDFEVELDGISFNIKCLNQSNYDLFLKIEEDLALYLKNISYPSNFKIIKEFKEEIIIKEENKDDIKTDFIEKYDEEYDTLKNQSEEIILKNLESNFERMKIERSNANAFKKGDYIFSLIRDITSNSECVDINGFIFQADFKETRKGKTIATIGVDDGSDAIIVKFISNTKSLLADDLKNLKVGKNIRIKGRVDIDMYNKGLYVMGHYFDMLPDTPLRNDLSEEKRVELHLHTNMSEMDGLTNITKYVELAKHMGMKSLAITDHAVCQAYPEAQNAQKKYDIKIIYGCELNLIEDSLNATINPNKNINLKDAKFICFDLESTGLSLKYDRITEFGAVKIENGLIKDRIDFLINPEMHIPEKIQEKTNITDEMVKKCKTIKELLPEILEFIGDDYILVSHNIEFDYGMLNEAMVRNGFGKLNKPAIDTLQLDRYINPSARDHKLGSMCKRFDVIYDEKSAHRADYDAEVLSDCFISIRNLLLKGNKELKIIGNEKLSHYDLKSLKIDKSLYNHLRARHATVYCKNKIGLKNLYKIVSASNTDYMGKVPLTPRDVLEKYRDGLIVGSACFNGEVFYSSLYRNKERLNEVVKFYDFIELQPLPNYVYLLNNGECPSLERLHQTIFDIIEAANINNKIICATGDCHYLNETDKKYRDIYIGIKGIGGTLHPLRLNDPSFENPDQHFRSTDEMLKEFEYLGKDKAYEYVITNTNKIADMCERFEPIPEKLFTPEIENCENLLRELCFKNAHKLYGDNLPKVIEERLETELNGIIGNGYAVTYYIAHKLVKKSNEDGYIVGSRGSVGSSFAATMAEITEVNPLDPHYRCPKCKHFEFYVGEEDIRSGFDLPLKKCPHCGENMVGDGQSIPFQTFLGFSAEKVPDIDLNFPADYQATAHQYTKVLLGEENVFRAGTISTTQFKTAYGYVKKYYENKGIDTSTISNARISSLAFGCQDVKRTTGQHPGGIVVVPTKYDVYDFMPIQYPAGDVNADWKTTHFDFSSIHDLLLKLDMLGHVDPQALKMMCDLTNVKINDIPLNDPKVISLFSTDTALNIQHKYLPIDNGASGIPEFGTNFVRQMLRETKPKTFGDLMIISGLSHGTDVWTNNQQDLVKNNIVDLRGVIGCRDDIMTYLISAGMDRSLSFKIMEAVRKGKGLTKEQEDEMIAHNVPEYYITSCKNIKYLFPKGHACAYVTMAVRVGYFKIYYPLEYYATFFTLRSDAYDIKVMISGIDGVHAKLEEFKQRKASKNPLDALSKKEEDVEKTLWILLEMLERGYTMKNISLERSDSTKFIVDKEEKALIPPFKVLDGFGDTSGISLIEARNEKMFTSLEDLEKRSKITKTNIKDLRELGVLDNLKNDESISLFDFSF